MKYLLAIALLSLSGLTQAQAEDVTPEQRAAITNVFKAHIGAVFNSSRITFDHGKVTGLKVFMTDYLTALRDIDTTAAPIPFRKAWGDYVEAIRQKKEAGGRMIMKITAGAFGFPVSAHIAFNGLAKTVRTDPDALWHELENVSMDYGVEPDKIHLP